MRISIGSIALASASLSGGLLAQTPRTIPTVVAEAMSMEWSMFGKPQFFDGTTPTDWPKELVPSGARIIGGAAVGLMGGIRIQETVFSFGTGSNPDRVLRDFLVANGFRAAEDMPVMGQQGGFLTTPEQSIRSGRPKFCKGPYLASYAPVDSARDPFVVFMHLMEGPMALESCNGRRDRSTMTDRFRDPVTVPSLLPPVGSQALGGGSSGGDGERMIHSTLIAVMSSDSVLAHYSRQLSAAGWKATGAPASAVVTASQGFTLMQGQEKWNAALVVVSSGNRHQVMIYLTREG